MRRNFNGGPIRDHVKSIKVKKVEDLPNKNTRGIGK